jgi:hypothetical protein
VQCLRLNECSTIKSYYGSVRPFCSKHIIIKTIQRVVDKVGRAMALAVGYRLLTVGARSQCLANLFGNNGEISYTGTSVTVSAAGFPWQPYSTGPPCFFIQLLPALYNPRN